MDVTSREGYTRGPGGWGTRKFIASIPRMARVLGAPRGRRVDMTVNRLSTTTIVTLPTAI